MPACPACNRPIALVRASCMYCGAALGSEDLAQAERARQATLVPDAQAGVDSERVLLVMRLENQAPEALAQALQVDPFEARQRLARGGLQLWRIASRADADACGRRLHAAGVELLTLAESDVRQRLSATVVLGGAFDGGRLRLSVGERLPGQNAGKEVLSLEAGDVLLIVRGPIARRFQADPQAASPNKHRTTLADPGSGYRFHLHLQDPDSQALELDPDAFEFEHAAEGRAAFLTLHLWFETFGRGVALDDTFRQLTPALGPAATEPSRAARWAGSLRKQATSGTPREERAPLDNLAQFRFHSAWRALVERRRGAP